MAVPHVDVVVVAFGPEPRLEACLSSVLASEGVEVRVVLVDNGCTRTDLDDLVVDERITLLRSGQNLGFAGGCCVGVEALDGEHVALVNSDARVDVRALAELVGALTEQIGMTTACVLLADEPAVVNSAGNPVHFLGISWAGGFGEPMDRHLEAKDVASASGAATILRRELWNALGGFDPAFFLYCEDLDLSLRVWQRGLRVRYVPTARVWHHYELTRNARKRYFLERNRTLVVLTVFQSRTLVLLAPALLILEVGLVLAAIRDGELAAKLRSYGWLLQHTGYLRSRRARVQSDRLQGDAFLAPVLTGRLDTPVAGGPAVTAANALLGPYWQAVRRWL